MVSQHNLILNLLQTVLEELNVIREEFKVHISTLVAAQ